MPKLCSAILKNFAPPKVVKNTNTAKSFRRPHTSPNWRRPPVHFHAHRLFDVDAPTMPLTASADHAADESSGWAAARVSVTRTHGAHCELIGR